tara:strand:+ start:434 stop:1009 length:576 start_codon:yes stop_codon:yes gene_type:complete
MSQLKVNSIIPTAGVPTGGGGGIIQVLSNTTKDSTGSISLPVHASGETNFVDVTDQNVTITPTSNTSKILVSFSQLGESNISANKVSCILKRAISGGATTQIKGAASSNRGRVTTVASISYQLDEGSTPELFHCAGYLDSPNTTSAVTYTVQVGSMEAASGTWFYNRTVTDSDNSYSERGLSWITVMEVSA